MRLFWDDRVRTAELAQEAQKLRTGGMFEVGGFHSPTRGAELTLEFLQAGCQYHRSLMPTSSLAADDDCCSRSLQRARTSSSRSPTSTRERAAADTSAQTEAGSAVTVGKSVGALAERLNISICRRLNLVVIARNAVRDDTLVKQLWRNSAARAATCSRR